MSKTKKKFIIEEESTTNSDRKYNPKKLTKKLTKKNKSSSNSDRKYKPIKVTKKNLKKKLLLIESSSTTSNKKYGKYGKDGKDEKDEKDEKKEKIESFLLENPKIIEKEMQPSEINLKKSSENISKEMPSLPTGRLNEKFIDLMEQLSSIMLKKGEPFRARAYQKAQETIMSYPGDILNPNDLKGLPNIGPTIMEKLNEYVETGTLKLLEREKSNPVNILAEIYGVGPKKAKELVDKGITSIAQLRENQQLLNDVQKVGLKYYEDVLKRIPRPEIDEYKIILENTLLKVSTENKTTFEIVGSYRRGAETSGDIDVIINSSSEKIFKNFIDELIREKIILEVLSRGPSKCLVMAKIPSSDSVRRVDFLYTSEEEFPFAILYFTGSKIFNTVMRHQALQMGLTMNEHGLYHFGPEKKKGEKVEHKFYKEKDIFDYLNIEYKAPNERIDGRSVIIKSTENTSIPKIIVEESSSNLLNPKKVTKKKLSKVENLKKTKKNFIIEEKFKEEEEEDFIMNANAFKKNGITILDSLNEKQLSDILREANKGYYNEEPFLTDNEYDIIKEYIEKKYPSSIAIAEIGAPVERNKVTLPYFMGSMDKIKPDTNALTNWIAKFKGPYVLSCKLDGVSGLYTTEGSKPKLYTRGDGKVGQDISHLIPYLRLPKTNNIVIRGEFIIPKEIFKIKYSSKFANPRNMVSGIVNHKTINESVKDLHFVAYEVLKPIMKPSDQLSFLQTVDIETVLYKISSNLTNEFLSEILIEWRKNYIYEIDGVIVTNDQIYDRKIGNPEQAFAFKMVLSDQVAEAKVVDVIWTPSKDGYLKPRVQIEPINLGGVRIEYATGFNGSFINDNKIGIGAIIELIRSGDVIPHIRKVISPATEAKMPNVSYKWNDTNIDIMLEDISKDETVKEKVITGFFRGIGVEGLSSGNIARIIQAGFDSVPAILKMSKEELLSVEGFKEKTAAKLYNGIREKIEAATLLTIMAATNIFGRGFSDKKLELILNEYPNILLSKETLNEKITKISSIKGMAIKSAEAFVERIPEFLEFLKATNLENKLIVKPIEKESIDSTHILYNKTIVMTGFRDKVLEDKLKIVGAKLGSSVSKNTFILLVKDKDEDTGKVIDAKKLGVSIMTTEEFIKKYL